MSKSNTPLPETGPECQYCTVPVEHDGDICTFCDHYDPTRHAVDSTPAASGTCGYWPTGLDPAADSSSTAVDTRPAELLEYATEHLDRAILAAAGAALALDGARRTRATEIVDQLRAQLHRLDYLADIVAAGIDLDRLDGTEADQ